MTIEKENKPKNQSKPRGEHRVVFKGNLLPGFNKEQVVANIVLLTKLPAEKIERKFFSGKVVIIRRAHDADHAKKLQQLFTRAGLEVFILKDISQKVSHQHKTRPKKSTKKIVLKKLINSKSLISALILWTIFLVLGFNIWNQYNINTETPDEVIDIETSLANKPLLFLAHINFERLLSQQRFFMSDSDLSGSQTTLYRQLKNADIQPAEAIKHIISAAYLDNKQLVSQTVLLGNFSINTVKNYFLKHHRAEVLPDADNIHLRIPQINEKSCEQEDFIEISIAADRILISSDGYLSELQQLLKQKASKLTDLNNWNEYRISKLISLAFFNPNKVNLEKDLPPASSLPMMMAQNLINKNESIDSLFASVGLQLLPPSNLINMTLSSNNPAWLNQIQKDLQVQINRLKNESSGLPNLQLLLSKIMLQQNVQQDLRENADGDIAQLSMTLELGSEFKKSVKLPLHELVAKFFSLDSSSHAITQTTEQHKIQEKLASAPLKFWPQYSQSKLTPFNEALDKFFKPVWIKGPFAISIEDLLLESHPEGDQIILQLKGKGQNIDNVGANKAKIKVTEVTDQQGHQLLNIDKCGQTSALNEGFFSSFGGSRTAYLGDKTIKYAELEVRQKIKLKNGIKFSQVESLSGEIELNLATQTKTMEFEKTQQNMLFSEYGAQILFKPSSQDTLSYSTIDNSEKILSVSALNKNKEYLSRVSQTSMRNLFASGFSVTQSYQGKIAFIEVVYATEIKQLNYPFSLSKFPPYPSETPWQYGLEPVILSSTANWNKNYQDEAALNFSQENNWHGEMQASWHEGPLNLALYNLKTTKHWGTTGQLQIKTPLIEELRHNLSALEVFIHYPQKTVNGKTGQSYFYPLNAKGYYMNGEFIIDRDRAYLDGQLSFKLPYNDDLTPLTEISGDVIIHLPVSKHNSSFTDMTIGAQWEDVGIKTKLIRLGSEMMEFEILSNRDRLLQITLIDANKQRISTTDIQQGANMQGKTGNILVSYHGIPAKAILTVSEGQQTKQYPFKLQIK